jgi:hypothetical protein
MQDAFVTDSKNRPLTYGATKTAWDSDLWAAEEAMEFDRLIEQTGTMEWMAWQDKPVHRTASYYNPQVKVKLNNGIIVRRVRGTYGGDVSDYVGDKSAWTADLQTVKILLNCVPSERAHWMTADIKDFYLGSILPEYEYMWIDRPKIPTPVQQKYADFIVWHGNKAMVKIKKGIYGLPQAGRLAQEKLINLLSRHGYLQALNTPCLFRHTSHEVAFTLVVDDFGIKYQRREDVQHLLAAIREEYQVTEDWSGSKYLGMTIDHSNIANTVTVSMPGYVAAALRRFSVDVSCKQTDSPSQYTPPVYGSAQQLTTVDSSPSLSPARAKRIQEIVGVFLYYARAVDATMLTALNKIASSQAAPTEALETAVDHFLQYAATWPNAKVLFRSSDMRLIIHSDASYLSESHSRSRAGGIQYLSTNGDPITSPVNGAIDVMSIIIPAVVASASEAEYAALFINGQSGVSTRNTLTDLGYPQDATPIFADNTTACGIANRSTKLRRSKAIDMRFHWIRDRVQQGQYTVMWRPGDTNLADYFTKTHTARHYREMRATYVADPPDPD